VTRPDASVVIVSFNTREVTRECLRTLEREADGVAYEAIVVDNASRDGSADMVAADFPGAILIRSDVNLGFGAANNRGFAVARGRHVVLLNSDAFLTPGALRRSVELLDADPRLGLVGGRLVGRDGAPQPSARQFNSVLNDLLALSGLASSRPRSRFFGRFDRTWADPAQPADVDWVPGAYSAIRAEALERAGPFDERFFLYYEEVDLCRRLKAAGYAIGYRPEIEVVHLGGESSRTVTRLSMSSSGAQLTLWRMRSAFLYYRKNHGWATARLARAVEGGWHRLRAWRNGRRADADARGKAEESRAIVALLRQAWTETQGGRVSPPRPW
jgi:GT2 family glycosyltransferase